MIVIRQQEFNSKAQKARRAKFDNAQIPLGYNREENQSLIKKLHESGKHDLDSAMAASDKHFKRNRVKDYIGAVEANKSDLNTRKANYLSKKILGKDYNTFGFIALGAKPKTDLFKKEAAEDKAKFSKIDSKPSSDNITKETTKVVGAESKSVNSTKKAIKDSYRPIYFHENGEISKPNKFDEKSLKELGDSIAKHRAKAAELRAKKVAGQKLVKNLKTAGKVGIGVAGAAGVGYGIKKAVDKNKKEDGKEK